MLAFGLALIPFGIVYVRAQIEKGISHNSIVMLGKESAWFNLCENSEGVERRSIHVKEEPMC